MDGEASLFDLALQLHRQVATVGERPTANRSKAERKSFAKKVAPIPDFDLLPLLEKDQRFFRVKLFKSSADSLQESAASRARRTAIARIFQNAFENIWRRVPLRDRGQILDYWKNLRPSFHASSGDPSLLNRSAIFVCTIPSDEAKDYVFANSGHRLFFSAIVVEFEPRRLTTAIIDALAMVYRCSGREHWILVNEKILEPEEVWEREHRDNRCWDAYDRFYDKLEVAFMREHNKAVKELLRRWDLEELYSQKAQK